MEKKIIPWQKRYMVLRVHEPGAATSGDEEVRVNDLLFEA